MQKVVDSIKLIDLKTTISVYEKDGYIVAGITYVSKDDTYIIVFRKDRENTINVQKDNDTISWPYITPLTTKPNITDNPTPWLPIIYCKDSTTSTAGINISYN